MNCPVCTHRLKPVTVSDLTVDACSGGCGGLWFDAFELKKLETPHVAEGFALLDIPINPLVHIDHRRKRPCPRCDDTFLRRHLYSRSHQVEVDSCPNCNGYWLDVGELNLLRNQRAAGFQPAVRAQAKATGTKPPATGAPKSTSKPAASPSRRPSPAQSYYSDIAKPELQELKSHGGEDAQQARWIDRLLKFVLPK
jgi:Zn-finger nucleic acid-binding protein